jgi:hypothetical protein
MSNDEAMILAMRISPRSIRRGLSIIADKMLKKERMSEDEVRQERFERSMSKTPRFMGYSRLLGRPLS